MDWALICMLMVFIFNAVFCRVSLHLHASILLSTCLFSYSHGSFSYACGFSFYAIGVFYVNLSFSSAGPSSSYAPRRRWDGGEGHPFTRPDLFWCYPLCGADFFYAAPVLFLCSMGRFPSISMSLPPSPCLHPVVDMFVFLCPRVFLLCVRFLLLCDRCFFVLICPFLLLAPLLLLLHGAGGTGGRGTLLQDPTFFGAILYAELTFFMLRLSFSYAPWGAFHPSPCLSLHLHVSHPVVDMFVFLCPRVFLLCVRFLLLCDRCFFVLICPFLLLAPLLLLLHGAGGTGGRGTLLQDPTFFGAILYAELTFFMLRLSFSYAPWGAFHPSPCLSLHLHVSHPVVDMFVFGLRNLPFFMLLLSFLWSMGQGMGGGGHGAH